MKFDEVYQLANKIADVDFNNSGGPVVAVGRKKTVMLHWACMKIAEKLVGEIEEKK